MKALHNISYGLYVLTAKTEKMNGCIINTLTQLTSTPKQVAVTVNKDNFTSQMIEETGIFNVSILDESTTFDLIKRFGFASGKTTDKFLGFTDFAIADNGVPYLTKHANAYISCVVKQKIDVGTHVVFVAEVISDVVLGNGEPLTYARYLQNVKKPLDSNQGKWRCRVCGYVYEGENLPTDFICPLCKHPAEDFVKEK